MKLIWEEQKRAGGNVQEKVIQQPEGDNSDWYKHTEF